MSFDLHLLDVSPGPDEVARAAGALAELGAFPPHTRPRAEAERRKERLAAALIRLEPAYERFARDFESLARGKGRRSRRLARAIDRWS